MNSFSGGRDTSVSHYNVHIENVSAWNGVLLIRIEIIRSGNMAAKIIGNEQLSLCFPSCRKTIKHCGKEYRTHGGKIHLYYLF